MNAPIDENGRVGMICASELDGRTIIPIKVNPVNHGIKVDDDTVGSDNGNNNDVAMLDENSKQVMLGLSSDGSGRLIEIYANSNGEILINSN